MTTSPRTPRSRLGVPRRRAARDGSIRRAHPIAWKALAATWMIWVFNSMDYSFLAVLSPVIIDTFQISATTLTTYIALIMILRAVVDLPISAWSDRVGSGWRRKYVWTPIVVFYSVVSFAAVFRVVSGSVGALFVSRAAVNVGAVACETLGVSATAEWWAKQHRGFAVGFHHTGFPVGAFLAGQIAAVVLAVFGNENWRLVFWFSLLSLPVVAYYWWLSTPQRMATVHDWIDAQGLDRPIASATVRPEGAWTDVLRRREVVLAGVYTALFMAVFIMFSVAFPLYLAFIGGYSFAKVAAYSVLWAITGAIFQVVLPAWSDRIGRKKLLVGAGFYAAAVLLMLPFATGAVMVFTVQVLYGVVVNAVYPIAFAVCADAAPPGRVATAVSIGGTALWAGGAVGMLVTGRLIDLFGGVESTTGYVAVFVLMSALSLAAGVMYMFARETAGPTQRTPHVPA